MAHARRFVRELLGPEQVADTVEMCISELVTNASAPRSALLYPRFSREELKEGSWV